MPIIDFTEIAAPNKGSRNPDSFEQFARDFFHDVLGYKIEREPARGSDGGMDLVVQDTLGLRWVVSCKHFAHGNNAVGLYQEKDIVDRVLRRNCDGFIGFYSTIASSGLEQKLHDLVPKCQSQIYDGEKIESRLVSSDAGRLLAHRYFTRSMAVYTPAALTKPSLADSILALDTSSPHFHINVQFVDGHRVFSLSEKYPGAFAQNPMEISGVVAIPDTPIGRRQLEQLKKFNETGAPLIIRGEFMSEFRSPALLRELMFGDDFPEMVELRPLPSQDFHLAVLEATNPDGKKTIIKGIELRLMQSGTHEATFSNSLQKKAWLITMVCGLVPNPEGMTATHFNLQLSKYGISVDDAAVICDWSEALQHGGTISLRLPRLGTTLLEREVEPPDVGHTINVYAPTIRKLQHIQDISFIPLQLPPEGFTAKDFNTIEQVYRAMTTGQSRGGFGGWPFGIDRASAARLLDDLRTNGHTTFHGHISNMMLDVLGMNLPLGRALLRISDVTLSTKQRRELRKSVQSSGPDDTIMIDLKPFGEAVIDFWFERWLPTVEWREIAANLDESAGQLS
jgi:hypothetical protein